MKKLYLAYLPHAIDQERYLVKKVVQTTAYVPGQYLSKSEVDGLCRNRGQWVVTIEGQWVATIEGGN